MQIIYNYDILKIIDEEICEGDVLWICTYCITASVLRRLIAVVSGRAISVRILSEYPSEPESQNNLYLANSVIEKLDWVELRTNKNTESVYHEKRIIIGDRLIIIGSANFTGAGLSDNRNIENVYLIDDVDIIKDEIKKVKKLWDTFIPYHEVAKTMVNKEDFPADKYYFIDDKKRLGPGAVIDYGKRFIELLTLESDTKGNHSKKGVKYNELSEYPSPVSRLGSVIKRGDYSKHDLRLFSYWLLAEHRGGQLFTAEHRDFKHQAALVAFATAEDIDERRRLLIADEVGLGKTIEIGLILKELIKRKPDIRILYICPGGLVMNVLQEFDRMGLRDEKENGIYFNHYSTADLPGIGNLFKKHPFWVASSHKLVHGSNEKLIVKVPWDVIIVDECHHYNAYGGLTYTNGHTESSLTGSGHFYLVRSILKFQKERAHENEIRVYFLSGTPHRGHHGLFLNLLSLLLEGTEESKLSREELIVEKAKGRVIYRIKEDITDYENRRIFPGRSINKPINLKFGDKYRIIYDSLKKYFDDSYKGKDKGWAKAQALQLAASSPIAGYAYLLRRYARSFQEDTNSNWFNDHIKNLPGYRRINKGAEDKIISNLLTDAGIEKNVEDDNPREDMDSGVAGSKDEKEPLIELIDEFGNFIHDDEAKIKHREVLRLLEKNQEDKFVIFAHSLDSVWSLYRFLREYGYDVSLIVGDQDQETRRSEINEFYENKRVLVSSSAGGEGINLQVAHRLIHFDLPWNPIALEQRIGRIHRIGSTKTIIVDTLLIKESREGKIFERLVQRAWQVACSLEADKERREYILRRIMGNIPIETIKDIYVAANTDLIAEAIEKAKNDLEYIEGTLTDLRTQITDDIGLAKPEHLIRLLTAAGLIKNAGSRSWEEKYYIEKDISNNTEDRYFKDPSHEEDYLEIVTEKKSVTVYQWVDDNNDGRVLTTDRDAAFFLRKNGEKIDLIGIDHPRVERKLLNLRVGKSKEYPTDLDISFRVIDREATYTWLKNTEHQAALLFYFVARKRKESENVEVLADEKLVGAVVFPNVSGFTLLNDNGIEDFVTNPPEKYPVGGEPFEIDKDFVDKLNVTDKEITGKLYAELPQDEDGYPDGAVWPLSVLVLAHKAK